MTDLRNFEKIGGGPGPRSRRRLAAKALLCTSVVAFASRCPALSGCGVGLPNPRPLVIGDLGNPDIQRSDAKHRPSTPMD